MRITRIQITLAGNAGDKLLAFAVVTFEDCFVVHDIKIIQGAKGIFVAMPSHKITDRCPTCGGKNSVQSQFCNQCGKRLLTNRSKVDTQGRTKVHADIAHPITTDFRQELQATILKAYDEELTRAKERGYVSQVSEQDAGPEEA
ncbi:MAG: septation protein SpoVG family protein [Planctomycetes bacterium]|nr:septation protein SpoVG family protein [Planctomycetota bacterium]